MTATEESRRAAAGAPESALDELIEAVKPRLRGWLHAGAAPLVLAAGIVLIVLAPPGQATAAAAVYTGCGLALFAVSGVYHRGNWSPAVREVLRRIDHSNVYLLIAGTYTPVVALGLNGTLRTVLLWGIWGGAAAGIVFRCLWPGAPRALYTALYIALGWSIGPALGPLLEQTGAAVSVLTLAGGLLYTAGGVVYGLKRPDPSPAWFGFHEIFHAFTIAAWTCQYIAISLLTYRAG
ncbi:PAQR family membrane homeostasis protein TrhA [Streptomyces aidingensis]|uniref:Hemolysin III n=1 Tax=Streptomyces aidingensis TaxID=910347 RepID=A0A1I1SI68_9ACTN|nr:hemolysin III family protein [Streptomyces aidingensis]SFD46121.1 hemolysin III [Streptomyces aidingensis]